SAQRRADELAAAVLRAVLPASDRAARPVWYAAPAVPRAQSVSPLMPETPASVLLSPLGMASTMFCFCPSSIWVNPLAFAPLPSVGRVGTPSTTGVSTPSSDEVDPLPKPVKRPRALARPESVPLPNREPRSLVPRSWKDVPLARDCVIFPCTL